VVLLPRLELEDAVERRDRVVVNSEQGAVDGSVLPGVHIVWIAIEGAELRVELEPKVGIAPQGRPG
jgi:hypothetical protein